MRRFCAPATATILSLVVCFAVRDVRADDTRRDTGTDVAARETGDRSFPATVGLQPSLARAEARIGAYFAESDVAYPPRTVTFVALKHEARLEVWADDGGRWAFIHSYLIRSGSGRLGPKLRRGDHQVPEGIYRITGFNPKSRYYLSMRLDYPNDFDRAHGSADRRVSLGGDIMIHGGRSSDGCLPVGDPAIEELYALATRVGAANVSVVVSPVDFRRTSVGHALGRVAEPPVWLPALYDAIDAKLDQFPLSEPAAAPRVAAAALGLGRAKCKPYDAADCSRRCDKGDAASCARAGLLFRSGRGTGVDVPRAWSLLSRACAGGDALGCAELSVLYLEDAGLRRDAGHAAELARAACDSGDGHGCAYLADLCLDRLTYPDAPDACNSEAVRRLRTKAVGVLAYDCSGWNAYDCDALAEIYASTDPETAVRYATGACKGGDPGGCEQLARLSAAGYASARPDMAPGEPARSGGTFNARAFGARR
jgi:hypothetical protein